MKKGWKVVLVILMLTFGFSMSGCSSKVSDEAFQVYQDTVRAEKRRYKNENAI